MVKLLKDSKLTFYVRLVFGLLLTFFALPLGVIIEAEVDIFYIIIPLHFLMIIYLIKRFAHVQMLMIAILYLFIYFIYLIPYFYNDIQLSEHIIFQKKIYFSRIMYIFYVFFSGLCFSAAWDFNPQNIRLKEIIIFTPQKIISLLFVLFMSCIVFLVYRQGNNVLFTESPYLAYKENLENTSALPIFSILFLLFIPFVIKNDKLKNLLFLTFLFILTIYCVTRGFRMVLTPLGCLLYFYYFDGVLKTKYMILVLVLGFFILGYVNSLKSGTNFEFHHLFSESDIFILSHHADNLYGSAAGLGLIENGTITFYKRIMLSVGWLCEAIVPPFLLPDEMKYPHIIGINTVTGGGGLFVTGAYMMWGIIGVWLFAVGLATYTRKVYEKQKSSRALVLAIITIFAARWMSYDFHIILRFSVIGLILYFCLNHIKILYNK